MTTELDIATQDYAPMVPARTSAADAALEMLLAHDRVMGVAHRLAKAMVGTSLVPVQYRAKPEDATAAILFGAELGLSPIQSLQNVINVHGKPALEARTMVALLQGKGFRFRTLESTEDSVTVECTPPKGLPERATWTIERATKAGYVATWDDKKGDWSRNDRGKIIGNTKYLTDPRAMLWAKAAAELARHLAADVLLGIPYTREDLESEPEPESIRATAERITPAPIAAAGDKPAGPVVQQWEPPTDEPVEAETASDETEHDSPAPGPEAGGQADEQQVTAATLRKLGTALTAGGLTDKAVRLAWVVDTIGREVTKPADLTEAEADQLIGLLRAAATEGGAQ